MCTFEKLVGGRGLIRGKGSLIFRILSKMGACFEGEGVNAGRMG
jgi:hypothetical protein